MSRPLLASARALNLRIHLGWSLTRGLTVFLRLILSKTCKISSQIICFCLIYRQMDKTNKPGATSLFWCETWPVWQVLDPFYWVFGQSETGSFVWFDPVFTVDRTV